jgi:hypothetical protein
VNPGGVSINNNSELEVEGKKVVHTKIKQVYINKNNQVIVCCVIILLLFVVGTIIS